MGLGDCGVRARGASSAVSGQRRSVNHHAAAVLDSKLRDASNAALLLAANQSPQAARPRSSRTRHALGALGAGAVAVASASGLAARRPVLPPGGAAGLHRRLLCSVCKARRRGGWAHHARRRGADRRKDALLAAFGLRVLRLPAQLVLKRLPPAMANVRGAEARGAEARSKSCCLAVVLLTSQESVLEVGGTTHSICPLAGGTASTCSPPSRSIPPMLRRGPRSRSGAVARSAALGLGSSNLDRQKRARLRVLGRRRTTSRRWLVGPPRRAALLLQVFACDGFHAA